MDVASDGCMESKLPSWIGLDEHLAPPRPFRYCRGRRITPHRQLDQRVQQACLCAEDGGDGGGRDTCLECDGKERRRRVALDRKETA
jgi:hypothetical protein